MNVEQTLQKAGFTQNEVKTYLCLLKIGKATSYSIVKEAGISSGKIYETLNKLIERGLASYVLINGKKHFQAADPDRLIDFMKKRENELHEETEAIAKILPVLKQEKKPKEANNAEIFEGISGIKTVYELMLRETPPNQTILILGAPKEAGERLDAYFDNFNKRRIEKNVHLKIILNHSHPREKKLKSIKKTQVKIFPKNVTTPAWVNIFGNYVATFSLTDKPIVFLLQSKKTAESYKQYFGLMWKSTK
ncbi:hypothetical protein HY643_04615 [Candidatus Woesearchaeota archaeon]|nr:hypothetical protein [Candidatus Woesearchaeota archaeon]